MQQTTEQAFICVMCGQCCLGEGGIVLSSADLERLCAAFGLSSQEFKTKYAVQQSKSVQLLTRNGCCIFFQEQKGCLVHSHKPDICSAWPFFKGNLKDKQSWQMALDYCPGINQEAGHAEFVRQGLAFLRRNNLIYSEKDPDAPAALLKNGQEQ